MITHIDGHGQLVSEIALPGQRRSDLVAPANSNGVQLAADRFLLLVSILGFNGIDDNRGVCYQLRSGGYDGPVLREGLIDTTDGATAPREDGCRHVRQLGHPVVFGVPAGALIDGQVPPHANLFVFKCRTCLRIRHPNGHLLWGANHPAELFATTQDVFWCHFQLNDARDDIEFLDPLGPLRQRGYADGLPGRGDICDNSRLSSINQSYVQAVPYNAAHTEWVDVCHFNHSHKSGQTEPLLATLRYTYDPASHRYQWTDTGPAIGGGMFEGNISRWGDDWIISGRPRGGGRIGWCRVNDPLHDVVEPTFPDEPQTVAPLSVYHCADGVLRLFTSWDAISPYKKGGRNPLYCWAIDPDRGFFPTVHHIVFDPPLAIDSVTLAMGPQVHFAKLLPHCGGRQQTLIYCFRTNGLFNNDPAIGRRQMTPGEFPAVGLYYASVTYDNACASAWEF
jgi:hypothetical protein